MPCIDPGRAGGRKSRRPFRSRCVDRLSLRRRGRQTIGRPDHQTLRQRNAQVSEQQGKHHPVAHGDDEFNLLSGLGDMFRHLGPGGIRNGFAGEACVR